MSMLFFGGKINLFPSVLDSNLEHRERERDLKEKFFEKE